IKTTKLRGQVSQGIAFPLSILESVGEFQSVIGDERWDMILLCSGPEGNAIPIVPGEDVTDILGVIKYEEPIPASLGGDVKGKFPSHSIKTDEERIQNLTELFEDYRTGYTWTATEKLDGSSATFSIFENGEFEVSSRNLRLKEHPENEKCTFWIVARRLKLEEKMREYMEKIGIDSLTVQGELIGEGIQKNKYKLKGQTVKIFRVFDPKKYEFFSVARAKSFADVMDLEFVPIIESDMTLPDTIEELLAYADGRSALYETAREGVVFVAELKINDDARDLEENYQNRLSFKVISNKFILKHDL
ncbi:hypothetical protein KY334_08205, partial [Candidatus Woesearchaeota archaeon]|nr:hypothetical protein [Candidatus Woesearchaeota archaeon]